MSQGPWGGLKKDRTQHDFRIAMSSQVSDLDFLFPKEEREEWIPRRLSRFLIRTLPVTLSDMDYQLSFAKTNDLSDHGFHSLLI